jgi:hypothetical protein
MHNVAPIDRIWQITKAIEQAAAVGEWEEAARLSDERSPLVMSLSAQQPAVVLSRLREVHAIDALVAQAAQHAQHALSVEYSATLQATRNVSQYHRIAAF